MLIVDDDIRNIYSLTSVLESYDVEVLHAERGRDGIVILEQTPGIDVALIDIMMPEMDGYETMQQHPLEPRDSRDIPLIAVTAKAMKGDRQKCLDAGASDYIAKPVDIDLLLALLRVWIGKARDRRASGAAAAGADGGRVGDDRGASRSTRRKPTSSTARSRAAAPRRRSARAGAGRRRRRAQSARHPNGARGPRRGRDRRVGRRGAAPPAQGRVRGDPARRLHARHGRLRDRPDHPRARADQAHPDRLPVRGQQGKGASDARLCDGRGRLCVQAGRAGRAALQGRGVRRPLRDDARRSSARPSRSSSCSTPICAPMPSGCGSSRSCASPSSARRRSSSRCRSSSIWSRSSASPRVPAVRRRQFRGDDRLHASTHVQDNPTLWAERLHPEDRERAIAALDARRATGALVGRISLAMRRRQYKHFLDQAVLLQGREGRPLRVCRHADSTSPSARSLREAAAPGAARWTRSAS